MADSIEQRHRANMNAIADVLDRQFNPPGSVRKIVFTLFIAESGKMEGGRVNYISNGQRDDMTTMVKEWLARVEGRFSQQEGRS
ncbi:hypothetical protein BSL82_05860 [Tardibacter chloracetimidivorans]|uniref:Uncharacterized protein n=1 Tax=Tardibacter chloracetimidivorans TaxID=1921510 RepID=A0A1L3ZTE3_9SPHN|nr:hypothetical protein [Tardibacter chloracetimidivorans]API58895.1 hypothetical protein BSL82_05860 [Tardibacter chloracetimidivorans]